MTGTLTVDVAADQFLEDLCRHRRTTVRPWTPAVEAEGGTGDIYTQSAAFRRRLLTRTEQAAQQALVGYIDVRDAITDEIEALRAAIKSLVDAGTEPTLGQVQSLDRWQSLLRQTDEQILTWARHVERTVVDAQADVIALAQEHTETLTTMQLGEQRMARLGVTFDRLNTAAVEQMLGQLSGPLGTLLDDIAPEATRELTAIMTRGVGAGWSPRRTARAMSRTVSTLPRSRALTIARTETLRAYRESARAAMQSNDIVTGWQWHASLIGSCPICVALHGTVHESGEIMAVHPNCRCTAVPLSKSWSELGFDEPDEATVQVEPGEQWFARQPEAVQRSVLGPGKHDLYLAGDLELEDLVGFDQHPTWGPVRFERPLQDVAA